MRKNSWHARLYKSFHTTQYLPDNWCAYFWGLVGAITSYTLGILFLGWFVAAYFYGWFMLLEGTLFQHYEKPPFWASCGKSAWFVVHIVAVGILIAYGFSLVTRKMKFGTIRICPRIKWKE